MSSQAQSLWHALRQPLILSLLIALVALAVFIRFYQIDTAPAGGDADSAWMAIEAVDWLDHGTLPYYVYATHFPSPFIVWFIGIAIQLHGVAIETPRLATETSSLLVALMMLPIAWVLLKDDASQQRRLWAGIGALAAAASSLHAMNMGRLGVNTALLPMFVTLALWLTALAWQRNRWGWWVLAGISLAATQYVYQSSHVIGLVAVAWFIYTALFQRVQFVQRWRGWFLMAGVTLLVYLPNAILYARWSEAFTQRLDTSATHYEKFIWTHDFSGSGGIVAFMLEKFWHSALVVGLPWESGYLPMQTPVVMPLFFIAWILGLGLCMWRFRQTAYAWALLALPLLALADVLTSVTTTPSPTRQIALLPFHYLVAGLGIAEVAVWLHRQARSVQGLALLIFCIATFVPTLLGYHHYLTELVPNHYADPQTAWKINQTDLDISAYINSQPDRAYLLPYGEYVRKNVAWLLFAQFRERGSILARDGSLTITPPETITVIQPTDPQRARHTQSVGLTRDHWWVLLVDGQTYFLPPFTAAQTAALQAVLATQVAVPLIDASQTHIANSTTITSPSTLFDFPAYTPVGAQFALDPAQPELELVGYYSYPPDPIAGEDFEVSLYWRIARPISRSYELIVQVWDDAGVSHGNAHSLPFDSVYRTRVWQPEDMIVTHHALFLDEDMPVGRYQLSVGVMRQLANENITVTGQFIGLNSLWAQIPRLRVAPPAPQADIPRFTQPIVFGTSDVHEDRRLQLDGVQIQQGDDTLDYGADWTLASDDRLSITMKWSVLQALSRDYSTFLHLVPQGAVQPFAQTDVPLGSWGLPSGVWRTGDTWHESLHLTLPADLPRGDYDLWFGIYDSADGARLQQAGNDRLHLGTVTIP